MTLRVKISVDAEETHSAVVSIVDDHGEKISYSCVEVIDPGKSGVFFVFQDHKLLIDEIPFEVQNHQQAATSTFVEPKSEFVPPRGKMYVSSKLQ